MLSLPATEGDLKLTQYPALLLKRLRRLGAGATLRCCYEAGPTGFVLQRALVSTGIECVVIAPSLVPQKAGDRVKTDRRDRERDGLMKRVLALHVAVTKLERDALAKDVRIVDEHSRWAALLRCGG